MATLHPQTLLIWQQTLGAIDCGHRSINTRFNNQIEIRCAAFDAGIEQQTPNAVAVATAQALCTSLKDQHQRWWHTDINHYC